MVRKLGEETLKTGERIEIALVEPPDDEWMPKVVDLLVHKGSYWQYHFDEAQAARTDALETRFYIAAIDGTPVSNVMTTERFGAGILGHVFTRPEHRRKGIYREVMARQMADFQARGGHALILGTGFESPAYWIYHSFGFRSLIGGFMRYAAPDYDAWETHWFAPRPAKAVPMAWGHWPLLALLGSVPGTETLRSVAWSIRGLANLEYGPGACFFHRYPSPEKASAAVLETEEGAVAGCATRVPFRMGEDQKAWPGVWLVDAFTHPNFDDRLPCLLGGLTAGPGKQVAFVEASAEAKRAGFEAAGFAPEATLSRFLRLTDAERDVTVYSREVR